MIDNFDYKRQKWIHSLSKELGEVIDILLSVAMDYHSMYPMGRRSFRIK